MKLNNKIALASVLCLFLAFSAFGQTAITTTTLGAATSSTDNSVVLVASATNVSAPGQSATQGGIGIGTSPPNVTFLYVDYELMRVTSVNGLYIGVERGVQGTRKSSHASGALVWVGPGNYFESIDPTNSTCVATSLDHTPYININVNNYQQNHIWTCNAAGRWSLGYDSAFVVPPTACTFFPTTSTVTNTYPQVGASNVFVLNGTTNAAAGTTTLTCTIPLPTRVTVNTGAVITDITTFMGSQTQAPTSVGTATLGTIKFPVAATTETASTVTPVAIGGTVTTVSPTAITTVTTAGSFLTIKSTFSTAVDLSTDLTYLQYTLPFGNTTTTAMTLNTPGLLIHYTAPAPL